MHFQFQILFGLIVALFTIAVTSGYVTNNVVHTTATENQGTWKSSWSWKQRWVKTWKPKKIYVASWVKVWSPAKTSEYVPLPPIPANWAKPSDHHY